MTTALSPWEYAARAFETPERRWATPGDLARHMNPKTVQTPALDLIDAELVRLLDIPDGRLIVSMPPQEGKALALDTPIATPAGWTTMGELKVGDQVFDRHGRPCKVTWVSPTWTGRPCYNVTTGDGERITADAAHEWPAKLSRRSRERLVETTVLAKPRNKNAQITGPADLDLPDADLPIDPYVLGAWLGDGHSTSARITVADLEIVGRIRDAGVPCRKASGKYLWSLAPQGGSSHPSPIRLALIELGVWGNKHIPIRYLRASQKQRLALLQGLVDTDGYVMPKGQVEYCSTSKQLAEGVRDLVFTLGAKAVMTQGRATINGRDCGPKYRVRFYLKDAAHITRKAERCKDSSVARIRYVKATPTSSVPTRCIEVDSPDHTYLAGRTLLPTHNSTRAAADFPTWVLTQNKDCRVVVASYGQNLANRNGKAIRTRVLTHPSLGLQIAPDNGAAHEWSLAGHEGGVLSVGIGAGLTGRPADLLVIDDPIKDRKEADSETYRENVWDWWTDVASTRLAPGAPVLLILTRWHEDDLAGRLLAHEPGLWRVINIPAQADHDPAKGETDPLGRRPGEFMVSARRRTPEQWERRKATAITSKGSRTWTALYQGRPSPAEGNAFKRDWWQQYDQPLWLVRDDKSHIVTHADELIMSWDMAFKDLSSSDYVVGQVWMRRGADAYLLDQVHDRMDFVATCQAVRQLAAKWPQALLKIVEEKANGAAVINSLRHKVPGIVPENPTDSKEARAAAVSPLVEAGNVHLPAPELAPWVGLFIDEAAGFPNGKHDDQVDAMSQALNRLVLAPLLAETDEQQPEEFEELDELGYAISPY
ncbi:phage terminase large subunit [Kribbella deserti]|uniref:Phage terminase large subunit n=1 Tax=Kribbella deserti TaxID=1926257 RepID=A0ABV6QNF4_9ACTN